MDSKWGTAVTTAAASVTAATGVSLVHYESFAARAGMLAWTVWPYPALWLLATRSKTRSTRLFWSYFSVLALFVALAYYAVPRFVIDSKWLSVGLVLTPGYLLELAIVGYVLFAIARWAIQIVRPNQSPVPTPGSLQTSGDAKPPGAAHL